MNAEVRDTAIAMVKMVVWACTTGTVLGGVYGSIAIAMRLETTAALTPEAPEASVGKWV